MKDSEKDFEEQSDVGRQAASWTLKIDRGLSPEEQDAYVQWLSQDSRHREALVRYQWAWGEFDRLSGLQASRHAPIDPNLLAPGKGDSKPPFWRKALRIGAYALPAAAALAVALHFGLGGESRRVVTPPEVSETAPALAERLSRIERLAFPDGSEVELNRGARVEPHYTAGERRIRLLSGEANFKVAKEPGRPFVVEVDGVRLRALGTVFNVRAEVDTVDVIVTEGRVQLEAEALEGPPDRPESVIAVGQRAVVKGGNDLFRFEILDVDPVQLQEALLWQPRLLDFDSAPLARIVEEFNRRNAVQLRVADPALGELSLSCSFWSDNVEGFVRLLEMSFGVSLAQSGKSIVLRSEG